MQLRIVEIGALEHFNGDLEATPTTAWIAFREQIAASDGVLFVTPEFNRSIPGVLKNAVDVGSRPYGKGQWAGRPAAIVSLSPGAMGGFGANQHLRQMLVSNNTPVMAGPEMYLGGAGDMFDEQGDFKSPATRDFVMAFLTAFEAWVNRFPR